MKRISIFCLTLLVALLLTSSAFAAFEPDAKDAVYEAADTYGWNPNLISVSTWTGYGAEGTQQYSRRIGFQSEYISDMIQTVCDWLGIDNITGNGSNIVEVALGEVGLPDSFESPMGTSNVKYNTWYYGHPVMDYDRNGDGVINYDDQPGGFHPWCCAFVSWCADQCGLIEDGTFRKTAGCAAMRSYFRECGYEGYSNLSLTCFGGDAYTPEPGDILFFNDGGGKWGHIAIIVEVGEDTLTTVEGNCAGRVSKNTYKKGRLDWRTRNGETYHVHYPSPESTIIRFLKRELGYSSAAAVGVLANIHVESGCNPAAFNPSDGTGANAGPSYGICQWHDTRYGGRFTALQNYCNTYGYDYTTLEGQLWYLKYELETGYSGVNSQLLSVQNTVTGARQAARYWCVGFEKPAYAEAQAVTRGNIAAEYWKTYGSTD